MTPMRSFLLSIADALDVIAALGALGAVVFFFASLSSIDTGPEFVQVALFALLLAIIPYCLAGAIHRIVARG